MESDRIDLLYIAIHSKINNAKLLKHVTNEFELVSIKGNAAVHMTSVLLIPRLK